MKLILQKEHGCEYSDNNLTWFVFAINAHFYYEPNLETNKYKGGNQIDQSDNKGPSFLLHWLIQLIIYTYMTDQNL